MREVSRLETFFSPPVTGERLQVDLPTLFAFAAGFLLLALAIALGGRAGSFIDVPSVLIVFGGTFSAVAVCFSPADVKEAVRATRTALGEKVSSPEAFALQLIAVAEYARQGGILSLQDLPHPVAGSVFLDKALGLAIDGAPEGEIEATMEQDLLANGDSRRHSIDVLRKAAEIAPAMGLIGTLIGLVQMLGSLDRPAAIGPGMAVALLTTLYGAVLGHMIFAPLAAKLERRTAVDELIHRMCVLTALSVSRQENPRRLETALNSVLPPAARVRVFD